MAPITGRQEKAPKLPTDDGRTRSTTIPRETYPFHQTLFIIHSTYKSERREKDRETVTTLQVCSEPMLINQTCCLPKVSCFIDIVTSLEMKNANGCLLYILPHVHNRPERRPPCSQLSVRSEPVVVASQELPQIDGGHPIADHSCIVDQSLLG